MGAWWYFYNVTIGDVKNTLPIEGMEIGLAWVAKFDTCFEKEEQIIIFKSVISINKWSPYDTIEAVSDADDESIFYKDNGCGEEVFYSEEEFNLKCNHPKIKLATKPIKGVLFGEKKRKNEFNTESIAKKPRLANEESLRLIPPTNTTTNNFDKKRNDKLEMNIGEKATLESILDFIYKEKMTHYETLLKRKMDKVKERAAKGGKYIESPWTRDDKDQVLKDIGTIGACTSDEDMRDKLFGTDSALSEWLRNNRFFV